MRPILVMAMFLLVSACQLSLPGRGGQSNTPNVVTGGPITVTPLDAPVEGVAAAGPADAGTAPTDADARDTRPPDAGSEEVAVEEPPAETPLPVEVINPALQTPEALACIKKGGRYLTVGGSTIARACVTPTRDGGDRCERGTQCDGECLARSGTCAPVTPLFGCNEIFQDNGQRVTVCIE